MSQQFSLMRQRRFLPFFLTQFLGAFNDNVYKNALVVLLTYHATRYSTLEAGVLVNLCAGLFILPFFLFSATAGQIADKFEKSRLIRFTKLIEIVVMLLACAAFAAESLGLMLTVLFLMGAQASLFGPVKYALLPQQLREDELIGGNALVESGTFIAILIGTVTGGVLVPLHNGTLWVSLFGVALALLGYFASRGIPLAPAASPDLKINWNLATETWRNLSFTRSNRTIFLAILGISWFWFYGAMFLSQFPAYAKDSLGGNEHTITLLLAVFSIGIGLGSLLCERLSCGRVELGLVPFGSIGLSLFALDLWWSSPIIAAGAAPLSLLEVLSHFSTWRALFDLAGIGVFGGFYIVPLFALLQTRSEASRRSRVIAGNNIFNALFMVVAAAMGAGLVAAGFSVPQIFLVTGLLNAFIAIYIYTLLPEFLLRFIVWMLIHSIYRLEVKGVEHVPESGPAVLLCNHGSAIDMLIVMAASRRPIRFVMRQHAFNTPVLGSLLRRCQAIAAADDLHEHPVMYEQITAALGKGEIVVLFNSEQAGSLAGDPVINTHLRQIAQQAGAPLIITTQRGKTGADLSAGAETVEVPKKRSLFSHITLVCEKVGNNRPHDQRTGYSSC